MSETIQSTQPSLAGLTIRRIETFPIRVPLARTTGEAATR